MGHLTNRYLKGPWEKTNIQCKHCGGRCTYVLSGPWQNHRACLHCDAVDASRGSGEVI